MGKKLYIGNLPFTATDAALLSIFSQVGKVESAKIIIDRRSGRSKGYGFVEMATDEDAADSVQKYHGAEFEGRSIQVSEARPSEPRDNEQGGADNNSNRGGRDGNRGRDRPRGRFDRAAGGGGRDKPAGRGRFDRERSPSPGSGGGVMSPVSAQRETPPSVVEAAPAVDTSSETNTGEQ